MRDIDEVVSNQEQIEKQLAELCDRNREALLGVVRLIMANQPAQRPADNHGEEIRQAIARIKSKEFISANEAAVLFGCSPQHLRNLVQRAIDGEATQPIPFRDLDGVITFPLPELIEWSRRPKERAKKRASKNRRHLQAVAS